MCSHIIIFFLILPAGALILSLDHRDVEEVVRFALEVISTSLCGSDEVIRLWSPSCQRRTVKPWLEFRVGVRDILGYQHGGINPKADLE